MITCSNLLPFKMMLHILPFNVIILVLSILISSPFSLPTWCKRLSIFRRSSSDSPCYSHPCLLFAIQFCQQDDNVNRISHFCHCHPQFFMGYVVKRFCEVDKAHVSALLSA